KYGWTRDRAVALGRWVGSIDRLGRPTGLRPLLQPKPDEDGRWPEWWHVPTELYFSHTDLHLLWGVQKTSVLVRGYRDALPPAAVTTGATAERGRTHGYTTEAIVAFTRQSDRLTFQSDPRT